MKEFIGLLHEHKRHSTTADTMSDFGSDGPGLDAEKRKRDSAYIRILRLQPLVEEIAAEVDPQGDPDRFKLRRRPSDRSIWNDALLGAQRLVGILEQARTREAIFGPTGPALAAGGLHRWVWNAAVDLWDGGHYKAAVNAAASAVEEQTQLKLDRGDLIGTDLYTQAFRVDKESAKPDGHRLRFAHLQEKTDDGKRVKSWTSAHEGAMHFSRGCAQGIRNMIGHGTGELGEQEALECLAAFSVLARWIDIAEVRRTVTE